MNAKGYFNTDAFVVNKEGTFTYVEVLCVNNVDYIFLKGTFENNIISINKVRDFIKKYIKKKLYNF